MLRLLLFRTTPVLYAFVLRHLRLRSGMDLPLPAPRKHEFLKKAEVKDAEIDQSEVANVWKLRNREGGVVDGVLKHQMYVYWLHTTFGRQKRVQA